MNAYGNIPNGQAPGNDAAKVVILEAQLAAAHGNMDVMKINFEEEITAKNEKIKQQAKQLKEKDIIIGAHAAAISPVATKIVEKKAARKAAKSKSLKLSLALRHIPNKRKRTKTRRSSIGHSLVVHNLDKAIAKLETEHVNSIEAYEQDIVNDYKKAGGAKTYGI